MINCLAITPARDEAQYLPGLIRSMEAQSDRPKRWIVIDDGSVDDTAAILDQASREHPWITVHHLARERKRAPGGESAIAEFLKPESVRGYDFILRLDADLSFGPTMLEELFAEFDRDPTLGIAGAVLLEPCRSGWRRTKGPRFHTRGAVKVYSVACFDAIGGLRSGVGWDTIDEAHAMMLSFTTRSFPHIVAYHHRPQGAAGGLIRSRFSTGRTAYLIGYSPLFMMMRAIRRIFRPPAVVGSTMMLAGYFEGCVRRDPRSSPPDLVKFIRRQQLRRLLMMRSVWR